MRFRIVLIGPSVANFSTMFEVARLGQRDELCAVSVAFCVLLRASVASRMKVTVVWYVMSQMLDENGFIQCVSPIQSRLMLGHCFGEYPYCALRHGVVLLSRCPPEQV
jgi:hypothetical protein